MKKSYKKFIMFDIILAIFLVLNSFILNILGNYYYVDAFLVLLLVVFKFVFGFEKNRSRYLKDIILNFLIIYLISFTVYYFLGIFIGFVRTENFLTFYGIRTFIIPYVLMIVFREYLRYQMLSKTDNSKFLTVITCIMFIMLELSPRIAGSMLDSKYNIFMFMAMTALPIISNNIVCSYVAKKNGYKPNIFWLLIAGLYSVFLPFVPNDGLYIQSLIQFLFPYVLMYNVYSFYKKREKDIPVSYAKKRTYITVPLLAIFVFVLAYFVSGFFRYRAVAVATGSMTPNINVGDVVIVDQYSNIKDLKVGQVIAYKYGKIIVVHRLVKIIKNEKGNCYYTQGDANDAIDGYVIYEDMIMGTVGYKIPYIGLPTVWFNKL